VDNGFRDSENPADILFVYNHGFQLRDFNLKTVFQQLPGQVQYPEGGLIDDLGIRCCQYAFWRSLKTAVNLRFRNDLRLNFPCRTAFFQNFTALK
jgi:hypothetical protein